MSLLRTRTSSSEDGDHGGAPQEKRPAPQPPGPSDIQTVLPQRSSVQTSSLTLIVNQANHGKGPAPARPWSAAKTAPTSNVAKSQSYNPFEDDEDDELSAQDEANSGSKQGPPAAASHAKVKPSKKARAPPLPGLSDASSCPDSLSPRGAAGPAVAHPDNHGAHLGDISGISEAKPATPQRSGGKKDEPPTTKRR